MKTFILFLFLIFYFTSLLFGQTRININAKGGDVKEKFEVFKDSANARHGDYQMLFDKKLITQGKYEYGNRIGSWNFYDYDGIINFDGFYKNDLKDSVWTYYMGDTLQAKMYYSDGELDSAFSYYSNGKVQLAKIIGENDTINVFTYFDNGALKEHKPMVDDKYEGITTLGYKNGEIYRQVEFKSDKPYRVILTQNEKGNAVYGGSLKNGNGTYMDYTTYAETDSILKPFMVATYKNGILNGPFVKYPIDGYLGQKGNYINGSKVGAWIGFSAEAIIDTLFYDIPDTTMSDTSKPKKAMKYISNREMESGMPYFPGGEDTMMQFLAKNIVYPTSAKNSNTQGTARITFHVDEVGDIQMTDSLNQAEKALDKEGMRVVRAMPRWNPGFQDGLPVIVEYTLPIRFTMRTSIYGE